MLLFAISAIAVLAAWRAASLSSNATLTQTRQVVRTVAETQFPLTKNVLLKMKGLSGAEFVVLEKNSLIRTSTLELNSRTQEIFSQELLQTFPLERDSEGELIDQQLQIQDVRYVFSSLSRIDREGNPIQLLILYPEKSLSQIRWDAATPPLLVGLLSLLLLIGLTFWLAERISRRIQMAEQQVACIASGDFQQIELPSRNDELRDLLVSVNRMSEQLKAMTTTIQRTERSQILGQLAGGLAHQLRNSVTGAILSIQLHLRQLQSASQTEKLKHNQKVVDSEKSDQGLQMALQQLTLTEELIKRLLAVGTESGSENVAQPLGELISGVLELVQPVCLHSHIDVKIELECESISVPDAEGLRTAILNLVMNAIDATGRDGEIQIRSFVRSLKQGAEELVLSVWDNGPGPPVEIAENLLDAFVTSKPEGVGLGLALCKQVAERNQGRLDWSRESIGTRFELSLPLGISSIDTIDKAE